MNGRYYTPKEYETVFHKPWGGRDAVYFLDYTDTGDGRTFHRFWRAGTLGEVREYMEEKNINNGEVLCATTHCPPDNYVHRKLKE
jgi:hypothetical protein